MASANIKIEQNGVTSAPGVSRDDITTGVPVTLRNGNDADVTGWKWVLSVPAESNATLSNVVGAAPNFTPDVVGTYIIQLTVNSGFTPGEVNKVAVAVRNAPVTVGGQTFATRYLGIKEEFEANWESIYNAGEPNETGWWEDLNLWLQLLQTVSVSGGGGGGSQSLAQVLAVGYTTGGLPITGEDNPAGDGGSLNLAGGASIGGGGNGGPATFAGGRPDQVAGGDGGPASLRGNDAAIDGSGGPAYLIGGNGEGTGNGGDAIVRPGVANGTGDAGKVLLEGDVIADFNTQVKLDLAIGGNITTAGGMLLRSQAATPVAPAGQDGTLWVDNVGDLYYSTVGNDLNLSAGISPPTPAPWAATLDPVGTGFPAASYTGPFSPVISTGQTLTAETDLAITVGRGPAGGVQQDADLLLIDSTPAGAFALTPRGGVYSLGYGALLGAFTGLQPGEDGGDVAGFAGDQSIVGGSGQNGVPGNVIELPGSGRAVIGPEGSKTGEVWIGQPPASGSPLPLRTAGVFGEDWAYSGSLIGQPASVTPSDALTGGDWEIKGGDVTQSDTASQTYTSVTGGSAGSKGGDATIYDWPFGLNPPMTDQTAGDGYVRGGLLTIPDVADVTGTVPRHVRCGNGVVYGGGIPEFGSVAPLVNGGNAVLSPGVMRTEGPIAPPPGWSIALLKCYIQDDGNRSRPDDPEDDFVTPALDAGYQGQPTGNNEVPPPDFYFKGSTLADDITAANFSAVGGAVQVHRAVQMVPDTLDEFVQLAPEQIGAKALASTGKPGAYWSFPTASLSTGDLTAGQDFTVSLSFQVDALPVGEDQYIFSISDQTGVVESALFLKIADAHGASGGALIVGWQALGGAEQQGGPYAQVTATAPTGSENYSVVPGQEHHITISVSNTTGQVAILFDGVYTLFNNSMTPWGSASPIPATYEMAIGAYQGGNTGFTGHVRQLVMYTTRNTFGAQAPGDVPMLAPTGADYLSYQAARGLYYRAYRMRNLSEDVIL